MSLAKGANTAVPAEAVRAVLSWSSGPVDADASALLLVGGKVRDDSDFVFYNQPAHASGTVRHEGKQTAPGTVTDTLLISLSSVEPAVERILLAASADGGTFGQVSDLRIRIVDASSGAEIARFDSAGATTETAFIVGELYRRQGAWKFRAVGQGYDSGLAGLARDFGISVDDEPASPQAAPVPSPQASSGPSAAPSAPSVPPAPSVAPVPSPQARPTPVPQPSAPQAPFAAPVAPAAPASGPPAAPFTAPPGPPSAPPVASGPPQAPYGPPSAPPVASGPVSGPPTAPFAAPSAPPVPPGPPSAPPVAPGSPQAPYAPPSAPPGPPAAPYSGGPPAPQPGPAAAPYSGPPQAPGAPQAPGSGPVRLSKVTLTKQSPSVSLTKSGGSSGTMRVNLNWTMRTMTTKGLFGKKTVRLPDLDLDLSALWEFQDGRKDIVQAIGNNMGSLTAPPYILLDHDDRTGASAEGENLTINLDHAAMFKRILIFADLYQGADSFEGVDSAVATLYPQAGPPIEMRLDECTIKARSVAIALIENINGELVVRREARYIPTPPGKFRQQAVDLAYNWGLTWTPGSK
ncbi:hypothetical protein Val02_57140 [Virgisporangium aliadipatigenens]|uniref:TerD domain-containing protein n=1 Tax=Virgisporangium aliadipatigenens TaxID=741659 RepID=A0A8J3YR49_9ACTN|nr:TerD family protein [Virgisporangium aliadipatigenens]GIJ48828.1 hypothetical protein Val02_57140 [Virgisporangium aliadipatigenens]